MKKIHLLCLVMAISALPILSNGNDSLSLNADFVQEFENKTHYIDEAEEFAKEICDEGFALLKNSNNYLPLQKNLKISVFGKNSYSFIRGGAGSSAAFTVAGCKEENLYSSLRNAGFTINPELVNFYKDDSKSGSFRSNGNSSFTSISEITIGETPVSSYNDNLKDSFKNYKDAAVFVICREGTEGADVPTIDSSDEKKYSYSEKHGLELSNNEEDLLNLIEENFDNVIVVINSSNIFECAKLENDNKVKQKFYQ